MRMRGLKRAGAPIAVAILLALPAAAAPPAPLVDCWDGSFAYTLVGLRAAEGGYEFRITTQDESLFASLFPGAALDWGQADLDVTFASDACAVDTERGLFSCRANEATPTLTKHEMLDIPGFSVTATVQGLTAEFMEVVRAGDVEANSPAKLLLVGWTNDGRTVALHQDFDYPDYCDGIRGAFEPQ
jgi:hypothetical protein